MTSLSAVQRRASVIANKRQANSQRQQQGVALFIALIILLVISVLGITALRSSATNARVTTGIQASHLSFQGAQSAINQAIEDTLDGQAGKLSPLLADMIEHIGEVRPTRCVVASGTVEGNCEAQYVDSRQLVKASYRAEMTGFAPKLGECISSNCAIQLGDYSITVAGRGDVPAMKLSHVNVQDLSLYGPKVKSEL